MDFKLDNSIYILTVILGILLNTSCGKEETVVFIFENLTENPVVEIRQESSPILSFWEIN